MASHEFELIRFHEDELSRTRLRAVVCNTSTLDVELRRSGRLGDKRRRRLGDDQRRQSGRRGALHDEQAALGLELKSSRQMTAT